MQYILTNNYSNYTSLYYEYSRFCQTKSRVELSLKC